MIGESFDFYDTSSIKAYNIDKEVRYALSTLRILDSSTRIHSENVGNLVR